MIGKIIGQLLLASSVMRVLPMDAASLEWRAGVTDAPSDVISIQRLFATLPKAGDRAVPPRKTDPDSYGIVTDAQSAIVVDAESGVPLFVKRPDEVRAIGSITKLMSALVFLHTNPDLTQKVTLVTDDYVGGGRVYLRFDDAVFLRDVLKASLVGSDNTATNAFARLSGLGTEAFVAAMNAKAAELGMTSSMFVDLTGVGSGNVSTARDLTKLLAAAEANETMRGIMPTSATTVTQASGYAVDIAATNELLDSYLNFDGYQIVAAKTGYIPQAGYCLASAIEHEGHRIRVVALGADSKAARFSDVKGLAAWTFSVFSWEDL